MDKRSRALRSISLSLAVMFLLSCQLASGLLSDLGSAVRQDTPGASVQEPVFTLVDSEITATNTATSSPVVVPSPTEVFLPTETPVQVTLTATPTSLPSATLASSAFPPLDPTATFTLGTPLASVTPFASNTPLPTATIFRSPTPTLSGPFVIDLNGYWTGWRRFDADCGPCDGRMATRLTWLIYHEGGDLWVNVGLGGYINGKIAVLSGTEGWPGSTGWVKLNYILTLQPDGDTLTGQFWGEGRLPSPCLEEYKLRSCSIANGTMTLAR